MVLPVAWVFLAILALALSWATGTTLFTWVGYLMLALLAFAVITSRMGLKGIIARRELSVDRMAFGGNMQATVVVENHSRLPLLWLSAAEALPVGLPMQGLRGHIGFLRGRSSFEFSYSLSGARRGYYELGPTILRTGDLFGLSKREQVGGETTHLTVFPKLIAIRHARLPSRRPTGEVKVKQPVVEDPTRISGIRPYERGDGLRRIHWRATAHTGKLQSKLFEVSSQAETAIILNLRRDDYPVAPGETEEIAELAISAAASVAHHSLDRRQRTALFALGRDPVENDEFPVAKIKAGRGREHLTAILSLLGRIRLGHTNSLAVALNQAKDDLTWGTMVIVISPHIDEQVLGSLLDLRMSGFGVSVILVGRTPQLALTRAGMELMHISAYYVRSEADIRGLDL